MPQVGYVYVMVNRELPGLVKVGRSHDVDRRLAELNSGAGVAGRWSRFGMALVSDMCLLERRTHLTLGVHRLAESIGTEIFRCSPELAARTIMQEAEKSNIKAYEVSFPCDLVDEEALKAARELERVRKSIEIVCQQFPDLMSLLAAAAVAGKQCTRSSEHGVLLKHASERLASITRSWGLTGHEDKLIEHVVATQGQYSV